MQENCSLADRKISVIIPAKNEENAIGCVVSALVELLPAAEILVVDDGSEDNTAKVASGAGARVISHQYSVGNGAAIKTGVRNAKYEVAIFMDGDGQHQPSEIPKLLGRFESGFDMVVGARKAESQASLGRRVANAIYNRFASYVTGQKIDDLTSGFRVVRLRKFEKFLYILPNGFSYPTTSTMAFFRAGYSVAYEQIQVKKRIGVSHIRLIRDGAKFFLIIFKVGTLYSPLKVFFPISMLMLLGGLVRYAYTFVEFGRFTNMSALLMTASVLVFVMGLISEQVTVLLYKDTD